MSELKVHKIGDLCFDFKMGKDVGIDFYLKSEADKVIAEKDKEIEELKAIRKRLEEANANLEKRNDSIYNEWKVLFEKSRELKKQVRHHKYKRCLAMARWCRLHDEFTQLESERLGLPHRAIFLEYRRKAMWWNKWRKRWLELAERFK